MAGPEDHQFIKKSFFDHLRRHGFTEEHLKVYDDYFNFFLDHLQGAALMELDPEEIYHLGLGSVEELEGDDVVEAYLKLLEIFTAFWAERWEALRPDAAAE